MTYLLLVLVAGVFLVYDVRGSTCSQGCATTNVNIRTGPSTKYGKAGLLKKDSCLPYKGLYTSSSGTWAKVDYGGRIRYIYKKYFKTGGEKRCATTNVNIRTGPSTKYNKVGLLKKGDCLTYTGLSGNWAKVSYGGRIRYIYNKYLECKTTEPLTTVSSKPPICQGLNIITRAQWGARSWKSRSSISQVPNTVFVHHTTGPSCSSLSACKKRVRNDQAYHMFTRGYSDIGYSFLIDEAGNVYEGRGWMIQGAHTKGYNRQYGVSFIGDYSYRTPSSAARSAFFKLIQCGISKGHLRSNYILKGHRDVGKTACPGTSFYNLIKTWSHYKNPRG